MTGSNHSPDQLADVFDREGLSDRVSIGPLEADQIDQVVAILDGNDLPSHHVRTGPVEFVGAVAGGDLVGVAGLERYDSVGLLRSVAVDESARGQGLGTLLCDKLETRARDEEVETLYLLTTTAADFFDDRGYEEVERSAAPPSIQDTSEFREVCPTRAVCMRKDLK